MFRLARTGAIAALCATLATPALAQEVTIGGKNFTEQLIVAEMTGQLLAANGYDVDVRTGMGSTILREAQVSGEIDIYWEYTGTSLVIHNGLDGQGVTPEEALETVRELDAERGLVWLEPSDIDNTYAIAMTEEMVEETGITTISELAEAINDGATITFGTDGEFYERDDGMRPMQELYGFEFGRPNVSRMASGLVYNAIDQGDVDTGMVFSTDGRIAGMGLVVLDDDLGFFPVYQLTPVVRQDFLDAHPDVADLLNSLAATLDDDNMTQMNADVDIDGQTIVDVATAHLTEAGLL